MIVENNKLVIWSQPKSSNIYFINNDKIELSNPILYRKPSTIHSNTQVIKLTKGKDYNYDEDILQFINTISFKINDNAKLYNDTIGLSILDLFIQYGHAKDKIKQKIKQETNSSRFLNIELKCINLIDKYGEIYELEEKYNRLIPYKDIHYMLNSYTNIYPIGFSNTIDADMCVVVNDSLHNYASFQLIFKNKDTIINMIEYFESINNI
jgi:hypothetical protein